MHWVWGHTAHPFVRIIPDKLRTPLSAALAIGVILIGAFVSEESTDNTRANRAVSLFGMVVFLFGLWLTSRNRKKILWHTVIVGMLSQFIIALFVLRTSAGYDIFNFISTLARSLLGFASEGVIFLTSEDFYNYKTDFAPANFFIVGVISAIIFFVSLVQLLYYYNILQWFVGKFAVFFFWSMRVSGAEAVVAAASPFIGQGESAMLIRPFIAHLTMAELHQVMCSGFATIAGSVLIAYISIGVNPQALVSSCVMSIPASLAVSKMRWPEEEETLTAGRVVIPDTEEHRSSNALHAFTSGAWLGLKIAAMITSTLLCILALIGLANGLLTWWGRYLNINDPPLTLELIVGYLCYPIAFLLGVSRNGDLLKVSQLIGIKLVTVRKPHFPTSILAIILPEMLTNHRTSSSPTIVSNTGTSTPNSQIVPASSLHTPSVASPISAPLETRSVCFRRSRPVVVVIFPVLRSVLCLLVRSARSPVPLLRVC